MGGLCRCVVDVDAWTQGDGGSEAATNVTMDVDEDEEDIEQAEQQRADVAVVVAACDLGGIRAGCATATIDGQCERDCVQDTEQTEHLCSKVVLAESTVATESDNLFS